MSGYYRKRFFVPAVHSMATTSPTIEANIIESYFANHPFLGTLYSFVVSILFSFIPIQCIVSPGSSCTRGPSGRPSGKSQNPAAKYLMGLSY